jgi:hypothetical protein
MSNWLDSVPVSDSAYAFDAELLCEDCGRAVAEELRGKGVGDDGDSGTFPQGPYPGAAGPGGASGDYEADSAQFCGRGRRCVNTVSVAGRKIGCPLQCSLTREGVSAVVESVTGGMFSRARYSNLIGRLIRHVWADSLGVVLPARVKPRYASDLPDSLMRACREHHTQHRLRDLNREGFRNFTYADLDHAYILYEHDDVVDLCRSAVDDEGNFQALEVASVPLQVAQGRDPGELIAEAVDEGAWD